jgi:glutamate formiminotransferase/glutamate formiminotransferase/formiminotetrahydrofolate cyclodeaminase
MTRRLLLAVPNVSQGRDADTIAAISTAFTAVGPAAGEPADAQHDARAAVGVALLDVHSDPDHDRSVFTLAGRQLNLAEAVVRGASAVVERVEVMSAQSGGLPGPRRRPGQHPHVGALDVAPIVYLDERDRGAACAEALVVADRIGFELDVPVFLYGELAGGRSRAQLRRGGVQGLASRMAGDRAEAVRPDFGPSRLHPTAGATLVAAREPLVAFNVMLASPASVQDARAIAAVIREGGQEGLPGVRAIGVELAGSVAQVSVNIERPLEIPVALVVEAVARHARVACAELVGLAPQAALQGLSEDVQLRGFDPARQVIEKALGSSYGSDQAQAQNQAPRKRGRRG